MAWTSTRKPAGPHHDSKPFLVVHSSHSSAARALALNVRSITTGAFANAAALLSLISVSPVFWRCHAFVVVRGQPPIGRGALPTARDTVPATPRAGEMVQPSKNNACSVHPAASKRNRRYARFADAATLRTGEPPPAGRCR